MRERKRSAAFAFVALSAASWLAGSFAHAEPIDNGVAVFAGLDKITARITTFRVPINSTKRFGNLLVTPRACHTRPVTEQPRTMAFVEVDEILRSATPEKTDAKGRAEARKRRIFTGWMNAESPGLNAVEHPIFDVWLTGCARPVARNDGANGAESPSPSNAAAPGR